MKILYLFFHSQNLVSSYSDVIMGAMASQITSLTIVYFTVYSSAHKKIKAPRHWSLCGEFTGDRWIPRTNGQLRGKCFHLMTSPYYLQGFLVCLVGPSLLDLQITANTNTKSITMVFVGRAIGCAAGAVLFALVLSKFNPWRILAAGYVAMATSLASLPWIDHVSAVTAMYGLGGIGYSIGEAGKFLRIHTTSYKYIAMAL